MLGGGGGGGGVGLGGKRILSFMHNMHKISVPLFKSHRKGQRPLLDLAGNNQLPTPRSNTSPTSTMYVTKTITFSPLSDVYNVLPTVTELLSVTQISTSHTHLSTATELPAVTQIATSHTTHLSTGPLTLDLPTPLPSNQVNDKESTSGLNAAVITGTASGCALFGLVVATAFLAFFCMARKRRQFCCKTARVDAAAGECMYLSHMHTYMNSVVQCLYFALFLTQGVTMHINLQYISGEKV